MMVQHLKVETETLSTEKFESFDLAIPWLEIILMI